MPLYDLKCYKCKTVFEVLVLARKDLEGGGTHGSGKQRCPTCGGSLLKLLPSKTGTPVIK